MEQAKATRVAQAFQSCVKQPTKQSLGFKFLEIRIFTGIPIHLNLAHA